MNSGNSGIAYSLVRSRRKTIAIHITKDAAVQVRAPLKTPKSDIDRFVESKAQWVRTHLKNASMRLDAKATFALDYGSKIMLLGKEYPIAAVTGRSVRFDGTGVFIPPGLSSDEIKRAVVLLYKAIAKQTLSARAGRFAGLMGVAPAGIKITGAKTRWGSCSGKNSINFSWRLIMADEDVVDYVVVHELAHILEHNHGALFWGIVEVVLPDYIDRRRKLKSKQKKLALENWDV
jgi:predicted metal-dependent hydrolase